MGVKVHEKDLLDHHVRETIFEGLKTGEIVKMTVTGISMFPILKKGDQLEIVSSNYGAGDLVAYYCPHLKIKIVHQYLGKVAFASYSKILLGSEQNNKPDILIEKSRIFGKVLALNDVPFKVTFYQRIRSFVRYLYWCGYLLLKRIIKK